MADIVPVATEAEQQRFYILKDSIRRYQQDALEWLKAVKEVYDTALWRYWHQSWDGFCLEVLKMPASTVGDQCQLGQRPTVSRGKPPELPPPTATDYTALREHTERLGKRLKTFVDGYVKMTDDWPETELAVGRLREFDEELLQWINRFEIWMSSQGSMIETSGKLNSRILDRKKRKRKKV